MNVIGFNGPNAPFSQGGQISQSLNRVPFINATTGLHDWLFNANPALDNLFPVLNWPTMIPAALISIPAAINDSSLSWTFVNGSPYTLNTAQRMPITPSIVRLPLIGVPHLRDSAVKLGAPQ